MDCLSDEQLAGIALGVVSNDDQIIHFGQCAVCGSRLTDVQRLMNQLAEVHTTLGVDHAESRTKMLAGLPSDVVRWRSISIVREIGQTIKKWTSWQRIAAGGIGLSTVVGILLLILIVTNSPSSLSAMERMAKAMREVKSYSYTLFTKDTLVRKGDTHPSTVNHTGTTYWLAPKSLFYDEKLVKFTGTVPQGEGELLSHLTGIHPTGKPGMLVFHAGMGRATKSMVKTYFWVPELPSMSAEDIGKESPITRLRMVREGVGEVLRELGTKLIDGKQARGYVMALRDAKPDSGFDALEVWVDPTTDLPLELGFELKNDEVTRSYRITNCRWNIDIDPKVFDVTPPEGYDDITPPSDEHEIAEIASALKLYAELSGGHYPRVTNFDADAVHNEMLKFVKYTGQPRGDWERLQRIEQAKVGLNRIALVLRNTINAGYYTMEVSPQDKDKILLWWHVVNPRDPQESSYRVFYGDLRTRILPLVEWAKLVPEEAAAPHLPEN